MNRISKLITIALMLVLFGGTAALAGRTVGPGSWYDRVWANQTVFYDMWFDGGQTAHVVIEGDGDTDLDVFVYDQYGNLIDFDDDYTDYCILSWWPRWTGVFRIVIVNHGSVYNEYNISVN